MTTPLRFIPEDARRWKGKNGDDIAVVNVTVRCMQGRYLLTPGARANSLICGVLGRAQKQYDFEVFNYQFLSNHFDLLLGVRSAEHQAGILNFVNCNLSRELGRPDVNDWQGPMFERRARSILVMDEDDMVDRFRYILAHGVKEFLVKKCVDWPGVHAAYSLCTGRSDSGAWVDRSELWRIRRRASDRRKKPTRRADESTVTTMYSIVMSKLPCWADLSDDEYRQKIKRMCREIEEEATVARDLAGVGVVGAKKILKRDPHFRPTSCKRSPAPLVHCKDKETRAWFHAQYKQFCESYREAHRKLRALIRKPGKQPEFPCGGVPPSWCFGMT